MPLRLWPRLQSPLSLFVTTLAIQAAAAPVTASKVLTPDNFQETISQGVWFIEYFSPYCPHCRHFAPTWNDVAEHFEKQADPGVHLAQVNCALNGDLCSEKGVTGYPQMNLYRNGDFVDTFKAIRTFDILVEYLVKHAEPTGSPVQDAIIEEKPLVEPTPEPPSTPTPEPVHPPSPPIVLNPAGDVNSLTEQTFERFLSEGPAFIKFFAPWCGHCKKLAPTWSQLARHMQHKMNIAEVNCDENRDLCTRQGVAGYPTLLYYAHGARTEYTGSRKYDQLVAFTEQASNPTMQTIDASELERIVRDKPVVYLLLHDPADNGAVNDVAKESQLLFGSPPVYLSSSHDLIKKYGIRADSSYAILAFKDNDVREPTSIFYSSSQQGALREWLFANRLPTSLELSRDVFQQVMEAPNKPLIVVVSTPKGTQVSVAEKLNEIGKKWRLKANQNQGKSGRRDVVFTWMDAGQWGKWMKGMYGIKPSGEPEVVIADHARLLYYDADGSSQRIKLNFASISSTLESVFKGTAKAKHSENVVDRAMKYLNSGILGLERYITAHPYMTGLVIAAVFVGSFAGLRRLLRDDFGDAPPDKRYEKGNRLD